MRARLRVGGRFDGAEGEPPSKAARRRADERNLKNESVALMSKIL
jgi:hypothetical protein